MKNIFLFILTLCLFNFSCKKIQENKKQIQLNSNDILNKFFNEHRTSDPTEAALVNYIKQKNLDKNFIINLVRQIGFPRWDKIGKFSENANESRGGNLVVENVTNYHIPFVLTSQNTVNASMVVATSSSDTTISYRQKWQYVNKQNSNQSLLDEAEKYALYFMIFDKVVFNISEFKLNNHNLFKVNDTIINYIKITSISNLNSSNLFEWNESCSIIDLSYQDCPEDDGECNGVGGSCDNCSDICTKTKFLTICSGGLSGGSNTGGENTGNPTGGGGGGNADGWEPSIRNPIKFIEGTEVPASNPNNWSIQSFSSDTLPTWNQFKNNYPKDSATGCELSASKVYEMAGGPLYSAHLGNPNGYANACALRTSIALTKCGIIIPAITVTEPNGTIRNVTRLGANGKYYFITASDLYEWMKRVFGTPPPSHVVLPIEAIDGNFSDKLPLEKGIYIMRAKKAYGIHSFGATGHASAFDNRNPYPLCIGDLWGINGDVPGGIKDVTLWKLN